MAHTDHQRPARTARALAAVEARTERHAARNADRNRSMRRTSTRRDQRTAAIALSLIGA